MNDLWIGIDCYLPPCIEAVWEDGCPNKETAQAAKLIALYLKNVINETGEVNNQPLKNESHFHDFVIDNKDRFVAWNNRCSAPMDETDLLALLYRVADSHRKKTYCRELKRSVLGMCCAEEDCSAFQKAETEEEERPAVPQEIGQIAAKILQEGSPLELIVDSCSRYVIGAETAIKKLICCEMVQLVPSSKGLHPKLNGESGTGKTHVVKVFLHHLPEDAYIAGGLTPKALIYHKTGSKKFIFLDDYNPNDDLDTIMKQTTSNFHRPYTHRTVRRQEGVKMEIGSEMTWGVTSVDSSQDIQVINRQIPLNTDDSEALTSAVNLHTLAMYGEGEEELFTDDMTLAVREMFRQLRGLGEIKIRVPFWQRIEWLDTSNRRNPSIFMDLLLGVAALHCMQREQDEDGYYLATEDDFRTAKALFSDGSDAEELIKRLTVKERQFAGLLIKNPYGLTRQELSEKMKVSASRISQIARGKDGNGGLSQKLPGFDLVTLHRKLNEVETETVQVYQLTTYDPLSGFDAVVHLNNDGNSPITPQGNSKINNSNSSIYISNTSNPIIRHYNQLSQEKSSFLSNYQKKGNLVTQGRLIANSEVTSAECTGNWVTDYDEFLDEAQKRGEVVELKAISQHYDVVEWIVMDDLEDRGIKWR